jgi:MFS family permease
MQQTGFNGKTGTSVSKYFVVFVLATTAFAYYYTMSNVLTEITKNLGMTQMEKLLIMGAFYVGVGFSTVTGAFLSSRHVHRRTILHLWLLLAIFSSLFSIWIEGAPITTLATISLFWGIAVGLGMPACMASFADSTTAENRGSLGGILAFVFNICLFSLALLLSTSTLTYRVQAFTVWLLITLGISFLFRKELEQANDIKIPRLSSILSERRVFLYLIPWIMFCLVNSLETPILRNFFGTEFADFGAVIESAISSVCALIVGFLADRIGRKIIAIAGFALLGIGYAVLGLLTNVQVSWYLYAVVDGIAWGMFVVLFFIVLWGDLANDMFKDKYYLLGGLPFLLSWFVQLLIEPYVESISVYAAFSLAAFFLFLAVLPLMYAPETLPEKGIKERELKRYIEKAKKVKKKYA